MVTITEANVLRCEDCGRPHGDVPLDVTLPNDQWRLIHPEGDGGVLCAQCIVRRASRLPWAVAVRARIEFDRPPQAHYICRLCRYTVGEDLFKEVCPKACHCGGQFERHEYCHECQGWHVPGTRLRSDTSVPPPPCMIPGKAIAEGFIVGAADIAEDGSAQADTLEPVQMDSTEYDHGGLDLEARLTFDLYHRSRNASFYRTWKRIMLAGLASERTNE